MSMGLSSRRISAQVAVSDTARARRFYEETLGLVFTPGPGEGSWSYRCGADTILHLYLSPPHAGRGTGTLARWDVDDMSSAVDELTAAGVRFEAYPEPVATDASGIHDTGYGRVAWFKDPDGNTFALEETGEDS
jgi:catechol 2,3-dioxygenase-like lactoylglutathione lyase family enzyme